jgi:hypothetical protein
VTAHILQRLNALQTVRESKEIAAVIKHRQHIASENEAKIDAARAQYLPVAVCMIQFLCGWSLDR